MAFGFIAKRGYIDREKAAIKEALADQRKRLKVDLWIWKRRVGLSVIPCDYCGWQIERRDDCVMHEWLLKRSDLPVEKQHLIMHEYNCVLVHYNCHEQHGQTREFKLRCARAQYRRYGRDAIAEWVQGLGLKQHVEVPTEEEVL